MDITHLTIIVYLSLALSSNLALAEGESPLSIPKTEGSKSFDLEISKLNKKGISKFNDGLFEEARDHFSRAQVLASQFRDAGLGLVSFNLGLTLHKLNDHEKAVGAFLKAKKYARGNPSILNSELVHFHECGFNPSVSCKEQPPAELHIEGSN